jgi:hypothetical protein
MSFGWASALPSRNTGCNLPPVHVMVGVGAAFDLNTGRLSHAASVALVAAIVVGAAVATTLPLTLGEEASVSPAAP